METFIWNYHTQGTKYQEGVTIRLGNSYQYAPEPPSVDQRIFQLRFATMFYYTRWVTVSGVLTEVLDDTRTPELNMLLLEQFYQRHRMWKSFIYPHPVYGNLEVKFNKALNVPPGIIGGDGALQGFDLELLEQP